MNSIVIPPSPNWYFPDILACADDGTLVYGSNVNIVIINPKPEDQPADIKLISLAHHERISSVSLNSKWYAGNKFIASSGEDKSVKVWNAESLELFKSHNSHTTEESRLIGAAYAGSDKVVSVSEDGLVIVWKVSTNELSSISNLFKGKVQVSSLSICPHAPWLCAFGTKNGFVFIADLRLTGQIIHKLRGHEKGVTDLTWCPVPVNVFPKLITKQITLKDRLQKFYDEGASQQNSGPRLDRGDSAEIKPTENHTKCTESQEKSECMVVNKAENTKKFVDESERSIDLTGKSVNTTKKSVDENQMLVDTTDKSVDTIGKSVDKTEMSVDITEKSVDNTEKSVDNTGASLVKNENSVDKTDGEKSVDNTGVSLVKNENSVDKTDDGEKSVDNSGVSLVTNENSVDKTDDGEKSVDNSGVSLVTNENSVDKTDDGEKSVDNTGVSLVTNENSVDKTDDGAIDSAENKENIVSSKAADNSLIEENKDNEETPSVSISALDEESLRVIEKNKVNTLKSSAYKLKKANPWVNLKHADDDEIEEEEVETSVEAGETDFLKECLSLRAKITSVVGEEDEVGEEKEEIKGNGKEMEPRKILKARKPRRTENYAAPSNIEDDLFSEKSENDDNSSVKEKGDAEELHSSKCVDVKSDGVDLNSSKCNEVKSEDVDLKMSKRDEASSEDVDLNSSKCNEVKSEDVDLNLSKRDVASSEDVDLSPSKHDEDIDLNSSKRDVFKSEDITLHPSNSDDKGKSLINNDNLDTSIEELLKETDKTKLDIEKVTGDLEKMTVEGSKKENQTKDEAVKKIVKTEEMVAPIEESVVEKPRKDNQTKDEAVKEIVKTEEMVAPIEESVVEKPRKEFLLASASSNGSIIIWRAGTDGKVETKLSVSNRNKSRNSRSSSSRDKMWMSMCWISPTTLLTSGSIGELLQWDFKNYTNTMQLKSKTIHNDHQSALFSIAAPVQKTMPIESGNWREQRKENTLAAWTIGQERMLLKTSIDSQRKTVSCYQTLGNSVQCLAVSPIDPNKLAIGTADGFIKIWDLSRPHFQSITMTMTKVKPQGKVLNMAYHPEQENVLAYGTEDGHIGLINPSCSSKSATLLVHYFRSNIYKLEWGPIKPKEDQGLYACSEGVLILYNVKNPLDAPTVIQTPDGKFITQFAWKQDYSRLALGTKDGSVFLFTRELDFQTSLFYQQKSIGALFWHPLATTEDDEVSPYESWLASSASDGSIVVYDMKNSTDDVELTTRVVAEQKEHSKFIRAMCWSPHEGGKLLSSSEDGSAHVWDVKKKTILSTYLNSYCQPITACTWSPLDKNYAILSGRQCTLFIININDYKPMTKEDVQKEMNRRKKILGGNPLKEEKQQKVVEEVPVVKKNVNSRDLMLTSVTSLQRDKDSMLKDCRNLIALNDGNADVDRNKNQVLQLFGGQEHVYKLIEHQQELHASKSKHSLNQHLSLWKGDIGEGIKKAMTEGQLSPWLISMAPMVSPTLWQEACESYADQLREDPNGDALQAASYYLSCHKVEKAVDVLCLRKLYKEALVLAKCRLANEKSLIDKIIMDWATYYIINGSYEVSAQCYIALGKYEEAAKALYKRSDVEILELAVELAEKTNNTEMINTIKYRYESFKTDNEIQTPKTAAKETNQSELPTRAEAVLAKDNISEETLEKVENLLIQEVVLVKKDEEKSESELLAKVENLAIEENKIVEN